MVWGGLRWFGVVCGGLWWFAVIRRTPVVVLEYANSSATDQGKVL